VIGEGSRVGSDAADLEDSEAITLVGRDCVVAPGEDVPAGARLEPGSQARSEGRAT